MSVNSLKISSNDDKIVKHCDNAEDTTRKEHPPVIVSSVSNDDDATQEEIEVELFGSECTKFRRMCKQLKENDPQLTICNLNNEGIGSEGAIELANALEHNTHLLVLFLDNNNIYGKGAKALAEKAFQNPSSKLSYVCMSYNPIGAVGASAIGKALVHNSKLKQLKLMDCDISNSAIPSLALGLQYNTTLQSLTLQSNQITRNGMLTLFTDGIAHNSALKSLNVEYNQTASTSAVITTIRDILKNGQNKRIQEIAYDEPTCCSAANDRIIFEIQYYLELNKLGRPHLGNVNVPWSLWPNILAKATFAKQNPNLIHHILCQRPELFSSSKDRK